MKAYRKTLLVIIVIGAILLAPMVLSSRVRRAVIMDGPLQGPYLRYSKWRYNWRSPSDMGDGKTAKQIIIEGPMGMAEDEQGDLYVTDREARFIWKIEPSGLARVIAGTGKVTGPDGLDRSRVRALDVDLASPESILVDKDGNLLFADSYNHTILKLDRDGYLTPVAGTGKRGFSGDGMKATQAQLAFPYDIHLDSKGNLYITDVFNHRIRKVDTNGVITTFAGNGTGGYSGDGGPAVKAQLNMPYGITFDKDDNLLIADSDNNVIRKVGSDGIIHTIAGNGQRGFSGDGGPALAATFDSPQALAIDKNGRIYINDEHNNAIRFIEPNGTIGTLVGTKGPGFSGDGGPASSAQIADPENVWVRKDGSLLIAARDNSRLRIVTSDGIISTFAGRGPTAKHDYFAPISLPTAEP